MDNEWTTFFHMLHNVFNVIQQGSCVPEQNNVKSAKRNATPHTHIFTIYYWYVRLATYLI